MEKLYIYSKNHHLTEGIYGQCLLWLLELLNNLIENNKINNNTRIIFDINTLNNNNLIPNFIVPKNIYTFKIDDTVTKISLLEFKQNNKYHSNLMNMVMRLQIIFLISFLNSRIL